jgi:hypothetical protein
MSIASFFKRLFSGRDKMETELDAARARHGIKMTEKEKAEADKATPEDEMRAKDYDVWEDLKDFRSTMFLGSWATRKLHPVDHDRLKKQLEEAEKKRREKEEGGKGEG